MLSVLKSHWTTYAPPPDITVSEWADLYRQLSPESSAEPGQWYTERTEYLREVMDCMKDPVIHTVVMMFSAQSAKTEALNNCIGYHIDMEPAPILVVQPTVDVGMAWSKDRLVGMLRDTPRLRGKVKDPRSRDSGNTTLHKSYPGGHITITGANSPVGLAMRPIRILVGDELDRWPRSAGSEGSPLDLAMMRTTTFFNRKHILASTPTIKGDSKIEELYLGSDKRKFWVPCIHCGESIVFDWKQVSWEDGCPESAKYYCQECGAEIGDTDREDMVRRGQWRAESVSKGIAGFWLNALYSPWVTIEKMATKYEEAKRNTESIKTFVNTYLAETWEDESEQVSSSPLMARRQHYEMVPSFVGVLVCGVDVQSDRLECSVLGFGVGEEVVVLRHDILYGDPAKKDVWLELDAYLDRRFKHVSGRDMSIHCTGVDTGGHHTNEVYAYCRRRHPKLRAMKGIAGEGRLIVGKPSKVGKPSVYLYGIGVHTAKCKIYAQLRITDEGPGHIHFDASLDEEYFAQLTAEKIVHKVVNNKQYREFVKIRPRNEALDTFVYGLSAYLALNVDIVTAVARMNEPVRAAHVDVPRHPVMRPPPERRSSFVNSWRSR